MTPAPAWSPWNGTLFLYPDTGKPDTDIFGTRVGLGTDYGNSKLLF